MTPNPTAPDDVEYDPNQPHLAEAWKVIRDYQSQPNPGTYVIASIIASALAAVRGAGGEGE